VGLLSPFLSERLASFFFSPCAKSRAVPFFLKFIQFASGCFYSQKGPLRIPLGRFAFHCSHIYSLGGGWSQPSYLISDSQEVPLFSTEVPPLTQSDPPWSFLLPTSLGHFVFCSCGIPDFLFVNAPLFPFTPFFYLTFFFAHTFPRSEGQFARAPKPTAFSRRLSPFSLYFVLNPT